MIPFSKQYIDKSDLKTVEKVLKSDFLTLFNGVVNTEAFNL